LSRKREREREREWDFDAAAKCQLSDIADLDLEAAAKYRNCRKNVLSKSLTRIELGMSSPEATTLTTRQTHQRQKSKWNIQTNLEIQIRINNRNIDDI
jgi:hypothetical protein